MPTSMQVTYFPSSFTEECSSFRSRLLISSSSLKEESISSVVSPSFPRALSLVSLSWTSSRVLLPPGTPLTDAKAGPIMMASGSVFAKKRGICSHRKLNSNYILNLPSAHILLQVNIAHLPNIAEPLSVSYLQHSIELFAAA